VLKCAPVTPTQQNAFWAIFGGFCVGTTFSLGVQGAFDGIGFGDSLIFLAIYLLVAYAINVFVKTTWATADE
jgi:hypothetical protein